MMGKGEGPRKMMWLLAVIALVAGVLALLIPACTAPCDDLAGRICGCEPTADKRDLCHRTYIGNNPVTISSQRQDVCDQLLKGCSCDALDAGNYAACGLANQRDF